MIQVVGVEPVCVNKIFVCQMYLFIYFIKTIKLIIIIRKVEKKKIHEGVIDLSYYEKQTSL